MYYDTKASGVRIKNLRKDKRLTQEQLSGKLNITIDHLGRIENGRSGLSIDLLIEISFYFHVSLDYLLLGRRTQPDEIKNEIGNMIDTLREMQQRL